MRDRALGRWRPGPILEIAEQLGVDLDSESGGRILASISQRVEERLCLLGPRDDADRTHAPLAIEPRIATLPALATVVSERHVVTSAATSSNADLWWKPNFGIWSSPKSARPWPDWVDILALEFPSSMPARVHDVQPDPQARVFVMDRPTDWIDLSTTYPRSTGRGILPDFDAIAARADGVWFTRRFVAGVEGSAMAPPSSVGYEMGGVACESVLSWSGRFVVDGSPTCVVGATAVWDDPPLDRAQRDLVDACIERWRPRAR